MMFMKRPQSCTTRDNIPNEKSKFCHAQNSPMVPLNTGTQLNVRRWKSPVRTYSIIKLNSNINSF